MSDINRRRVNRMTVVRDEAALTAKWEETMDPLVGVDAGYMDVAEERKRDSRQATYYRHEVYRELLYIAHLEEVAHGGPDYWKFGAKGARIRVHEQGKAAGDCEQGREGGSQGGDSPRVDE